MESPPDSQSTTESPPVSEIVDKQETAMKVFADSTMFVEHHSVRWYGKDLPRCLDGTMV